MKSFLILSVLVYLCAFNSISCIDLGLKNIVDSAKDVTSGLAKDITNKLPTAKGLFETSKQLVAGYPFEFVSTSINKMCSSALSSQSVTPKYLPDINKMQFQLRTACNRYNYPLLKANDMWTSKEFNPKNKVVLLVTGWTTSVDDDETIALFAKAYSCRGGVNFVALDAAGFIETLYSWSAFNTEALGMHIADGLKQLSEIVPVENIHLIGHSLGAHIVGAAGRHFELKTKKTIPRITGLDPAKPCFNEGEALSGLLRGDADFIDIIHTNSGVLGKRDPMGDIDFYPGGLDPLPPGCVGISCAHARAWVYYAETIYPGNEKNFMGTRCSSLTRLREGKCPGKEVPMGYAVPTDAKGNYFMEVRANAPYGMNGNKHDLLKYETCGACEESDITGDKKKSK
ncbi:phospholipase A1-like [Calliphora vicina]|uniref:phospholipase A1-like n=1 Tax=Calliphora vicina TaxID=7373 RepID=UPI00325B800C